MTPGTVGLGVWSTILVYPLSPGASVDCSADCNFKFTTTGKLKKDVNQNENNCFYIFTQ